MKAINYMGLTKNKMMVAILKHILRNVPYYTHIHTYTHTHTVESIAAHTTRILWRPHKYRHPPCICVCAHLFRSVHKERDNHRWRRVYTQSIRSVCDQHIHIVRITYTHRYRYKWYVWIGAVLNVLMNCTAFVRFKWDF